MATAPGQIIINAFSALSNGNLMVLQRMLACYPNIVDYCDADEDTLLHVAAYEKNTAAIQILLAANAPVNERGCSMRTPLHCAAWEGHKEGCQLLLANNAAIHLQDSLEENAIHKAATLGHIEVLSILLRAQEPHHQCVNTQNVLGSTPLHQALEHGHQECARLLIAHGANGNITDFFGYKPMLLKYMTKHRERGYNNNNVMAL
mmetsp:Transcript_29097/g.32315  ORF Transcript_29097/g.32315 Transcript_29097/m.32315 type:complete len:204 (-) Transcript_29097:74-685(-)